MLQSMTGFGRAQLSSEKADIQVEVKTLNSKQTDTYLKTPSTFYEKEIEIKKLLITELQRGKITLIVDYNNKNSEENSIKINQELVVNYFNQLKGIAEKVGEENTSDLFRIAMNMPDVFVKKDAHEGIEERFAVLLPILQEALAACKTFRLQEGEALQKDLQMRLKNIEESLAQIEVHDPERIKKTEERLKNQIAEWKNNEAFDENRFEQELIYYIEKLDITEEKVRLKNHLKYFEETLNTTKEVQIGKKLGFISQEIGREVNTIGSKANDAQVQRLVVNMKEELEKIKEQVLNVL